MIPNVMPSIVTLVENMLNLVYKPKENTCTALTATNIVVKFLISLMYYYGMNLCPNKCTNVILLNNVELI